MKIKIKNATLLNVEDESVSCGQTVCIDNGMITFVGDDNNLFCVPFVADREIDFGGDILLPGFVNAHAHNAMTLFRGLKDDVPLEEWLYDNMFVVEKKLVAEDVYYGTVLGLLESVSSGITTNLDAYFFNDEIIRANIDVGTRLVCAVDATETQGVDRREFLTNRLKLLSSRFDNGRINYIAYGHSIYTLDEQDLEGTLLFANDFKLNLHIHLAETLNEVGECFSKRNRTPVQYLEEIGFFERPCLLAHGVHIDKDDYIILQQHNVSIAHCPASNLKLGNGFAPIYSYLQNGINVCLGTDGPASNNSIDMFREIYLSSILQKGLFNDPSAITAWQALKMATINGATALGLENVGLIKEGYKADLIRIDLSAINMQPVNSFVSNIVYSSSARNIKMTMIDGKIVYENGIFLNNINVEEILQKCSIAVKRLKSK